MTTEPSVDAVDEFLDALCVARNDYDTVRAALRLADSRTEAKMLTGLQKSLVARAINTECNLLDKLYPVGSAFRADFEAQIDELRNAAEQVAALPEGVLIHEASLSPMVAAVERSSGALSDPRYVSSTCPCRSCVAGRARHAEEFTRAEELRHVAATALPCVRSTSDVHWCASHLAPFAEGAAACER